ncbi:innexin inx2-like [Uloborus diversus]|uniref:innexin inx2-like n=1 Tax=Uloborus diversus TaxID=327109 RepID=UPI0024093977|nr:innexin inx2-like [Uloborus diversus]
MEKVLFGDVFTKTLKNVWKIPTVTIDDPIFRLHYKFTGLALLFCSLLVSGYQFFGNPIMCIQRDQIPEQLLNTYCWIEGTFTLPKALSKIVGKEIVYPGVDSHKEGDEITEHSYYQWVCFVLFLQALMFCVPYVIWRSMENGRMKLMIQKLQSPILEEKDKGPCCSSVASYFLEGEGKHDNRSYALKFLFCEILNFINVVGQIYFINRFLGGEFTRYGVDVVRYVNDEQQDRIDPMIRVFPRVTKCTFHKYGSSGTVQKHDALCLLPLNILNEKIFVVMWFWLVILAIVGGCLIMYRITVMISSRMRFLLLTYIASLTSREDLRFLINKYSYGDWFMLYLLADNIDNIHFREIVMCMKKNCNDKGPKSVVEIDAVLEIDDVDKGKAESKLLLEKEGRNNDESSV